MMRQICAFALFFYVASQAGAQRAVPPRFEPLAKNERFRLTAVLGLPELRANFFHVSTFSGDGKYALFAEDLSSGTDDKLQLRTRLLLFDLNAKTWPREFDLPGRVTATDLSADGKILLLANTVLGPKKDSMRVLLSIWDLKLGKEVKSTSAIDARAHIETIALSRDTTTAVTGSMFELKRWDLKRGKELASYAKGKLGAFDVALLPNDRQFISNAGFGGVHLWDIDKAKRVRRYYDKKTPQWGAVCMAISRDGKRLATGDFADWPSLTMWEIETGKLVNKLAKSTFDGGVSTVAFAEDGKTALSVWSKRDPAPDDYACSRLVAWDGEANKVLWSHPVSYRGRPPMLVQGDKLLVGGGPNLFEVWSIKDGKKLQSWGGHRSPVQAVAVLPNGDILSGGNEGQVMTWRKGEIVNKRDAHVGLIGVLALDDEKKQWLSAGADKTIKLWAVGEDKPVHVLKGHAGPVTSLAIAGKGRWAASASADRSVKTWDLTTGKEIASFAGHADGVNAVVISPCGTWLASGGEDATVRLWPVKLGKLDPDREPITLEDHKKAVTCLAFSPDGTLVSGSQDQTLIVWDFLKGKVTRTISGHKNWVTSLLFTDDRKVLTTSDDLSMCWWNIDTGKELGRVDFGVVGDCPRCVARVGDDRLLVGSSSWLIYEMQILPAKTK
jgi:WD40 repeat protein